MPLCFDGVACTADICEVVNGQGTCPYYPNDAQCDDNDVCTDDQCVTIYGNIGCVNTNNTAPCDDNDNNTCTDGLCDGGVCEPTANDALCNDNVFCTDDVCDVTDGRDYIPNDALCDDGNFCTLGDFCHPDFGCRPGPDSPCAPGEVCVAPNGPCVECLGEGDCPDELVCNTSTGECVECTEDDQCIDPDDPDDPTTWCNPDTGTCVNCLVDDHCDDDIACTLDGCINTVCFNGDTCPGQDTVFCDGLDFCDDVQGAGTCVQGPPPCTPEQTCDEVNGCMDCEVDDDCDDDDPCTDDSCDLTTNTCVSNPDSDSDGVPNCCDNCPDTPTDETAYPCTTSNPGDPNCVCNDPADPFCLGGPAVEGCSCFQLDSDDDGISDCKDASPCP